MNPRTIVIEPVLNGFVIQVGCQRVVVKNVGELSGEIARYYANPELTEKSYIQNAVNKTMDSPVPVVPTHRQILRSQTDECAKMPEPIGACEAPPQTDRRY